ncbi:uncharacterized protein LOC122655093 [Telopea speciosissima]|uniref:uncharacterized protein LOC122655093 n=1 Tax=Telopea speciosissima TaxID=54955 RepID=UPI001CC5407A|nr:uncharacterized protein LOC122655093 [Telopea speciosissima]
MQVDPVCLRCGATMESSDHVLFDSPFTRSVWFGCSLHYFPPTNTTPKLTDWLQSWDDLFRVDNKKAHDSLSRPSFICWYLWRARNDLAFNERQWSPLEVIATAEKTFLEFSNATVVPSAPLASPVGASPTCQHWEPPPVGSIKIKCDAALSREFKGRTGNALTEAMDAGYTNVLVESDCKEAVELIQNRSRPPPSDVADVVADEQ